MYGYFIVVVATNNEEIQVRQLVEDLFGSEVRCASLKEIYERHNLMDEWDELPWFYRFGKSLAFEGPVGDPRYDTLTKELGGFRFA